MKKVADEMSVRELIEILSKYDGDMRVGVGGVDAWLYVSEPDKEFEFDTILEFEG